VRTCQASCEELRASLYGKQRAARFVGWCDFSNLPSIRRSLADTSPTRRRALDKLTMPARSPVVDKLLRLFTTQQVHYFSTGICDMPCQDILCALYVAISAQRDYLPMIILRVQFVIGSSPQQSQVWFKREP
jgi:hypothetical protein